MEKSQEDDIDKVNDLTSDLEDLKTTVEELQIDPRRKSTEKAWRQSKARCSRPLMRQMRSKTRRRRERRRNIRIREHG